MICGQLTAKQLRHDGEHFEQQSNNLFHLTICFIDCLIVWSQISMSLARFRRVIGKYKDIFATFQQQDAQEFLSCLVDGLNEDLNRIDTKP